MGRGEEQLLEAVKQQEKPVVQRLVQRGRGKLLGSAKKININYQDKEGFTALHQAAVLGNTDLACLLLDANASVDLRDKKGLRPLHYSAWKGKVDLVAALLGSGSSCGLPALNGSAPLHLAAQYGHAQVCKILLEYGADVTARQSDGCSPLDLACEFGRTEVAELLLHGKGAPILLEQLQNPNGDFPGGSSPLHLAARNGHTAIVRLLLQNGVDINWRTSTGSSLHEAVGNQRTEIAQLLIDCGIDVDIRSGLGQTAMELAQKLSKSPAIVEILRRLGEVQPRLLQVCAINDFQNILDRNSLAFTRGTVITVLEQNPNGIWKGKVDAANGQPPAVGTFPASFVQPCRPGPQYGNLAGSDDSGIHPHEEDSSPLWSAWSRSSKSHPTHNYINLDPRSAQLQHAKTPIFNSNVDNPSYEDVICSQPDQPITKEHVMPERPKSRPAIAKKPPHLESSRRGSGIARSRPSISNPGYEDVLTSTTSSDAPTSPAATGVSGAPSITSGPPQALSENLTNRSSQRVDMQSSHHDPILHWLSSFGMGQYAPLFAQHGYDMVTAVRASPSDLAAIRILNPEHRKLIADRGSMLKQDTSVRMPFTQQLPPSVNDLLRSLRLEQYSSAFARSRVDNVEKLSQTTWEDLQEMGIVVLGHQKKLMLAINHIVQTLRRTQPPVRANAPPTVRPKPTASATKSPARNKSLTPFHEPPAGEQARASFQVPPTKISNAAKPPPREKATAPPQEPSGASSELLRALNRRQKIIDDAEETRVPQPESGATSQLPQNEHVAPQPSANDVTKQKRHSSSSSRGPPPNPPKRVSSIVMEDSFSPADHPPRTSHDQSNHAGGFLVTSQPPMAEKTRPVVMKKPSKHPQPAITGGRHPPMTVEKTPPPLSPRSETGARFDLSALDRVAPAKQTPMQESGDDFEWPAPPPMQFPPPPSQSYPSPPQTPPYSHQANSTPHSTQSPFHTTEPAAQPPPDMRSSSASHAYAAGGFESRNRIALQFHHSPASLPDEPVAPPLPQKHGKSHHPPATIAQCQPAPSDPHPAALTADPLMHEDSGATQQMLDDITSMFDGLAQEFDEFLE